MKQQIIILSIFLTIVNSNDNNRPKCGHSEMTTDCLTPCEPTCESPNQMPCPEFSARNSGPNHESAVIVIIKGDKKPPPPPCYPGCVCAHGFVRNEFGVCIPRTQCPAICKPHSHFEKCGPRCQPTCEFAEPRGLSVCTRDKDICVSGCFCDAGYVKDTRTGLCVKPNECSQICPDNEHYSDFGDSCAPTCQHPHVDWHKCKNMSVELPGCYCNQGFIRDWDTKKCVREYDCPPKQCPAHEEWYKCKPCTPACTEPKRVCTQQCTPGCECKRGLYRDHKSGKCIPFCQCPHFHQH